MLASIQIRYRGPVPGSMNLTQREFNDLVREAWLQTGEYWHSQFAAKHFTHEGAQEYGYAPRSGDAGTPAADDFWTSYTGRKQYKFGHTLPLVLTGELRQCTLTFHRVEATATTNRSRCRVVLPMSQKANFRNPHSDPRLDMREELTRISEPEAVELVAVHEVAFQEAFDRLESQGRVSVAGYFHET